MEESEDPKIDETGTDDKEKVTEVAQESDAASTTLLPILLPLIIAVIVIVFLVVLSRCYRKRKKGTEHQSQQDTAN